MMYVGTLVSDLGCMSILASTGLVEPVVRYCCLCMVVFSLFQTLTSYSRGVVEIRITWKSGLTPVDTHTRLWT